jgi:hypothetical protein
LKRFSKQVRIHRPIGSGQFGRRFIKMRQMYTVQATPGTAPKIDYAFTDDPTAFSEWPNCVALFDKVRVCAMKIKFIPHYNITTPINPSTGTTNVAMQYGLVCFDPNTEVIWIHGESGSGKTKLAHELTE